MNPTQEQPTDPTPARRLIVAPNRRHDTQHTWMIREVGTDKITEVEKVSLSCVQMERTTDELYKMEENLGCGYVAVGVEAAYSDPSSDMRRLQQVSMGGAFVLSTPRQYTKEAKKIVFTPSDGVWLTTEGVW